METLLLLLCLLVLIAIVLIILFRPRPNNNLFALNTRLDHLFSSLDKISLHLKEDLKLNREESSNMARENRQELSATINHLKQELHQTLQLITEQNRTATQHINRTLEEKIAALIQKVEDNNKTARETITNNLKEFSTDQRIKFDELKLEQKEQANKTTEQLEKISNKVEENNRSIRETVTGSLKEFTQEQKQQFDELKREQKELLAKTVDGLDRITIKVEEKLTTVNEQAKSDQHLMRQALETSFRSFRETFTQSVEAMNNLQKEKFSQLEIKQADLVLKTEAKLEGIRETVEEKLQKTLSERLGQSFELVSKQLESVQKGLGEMQTLAQDVGGLKRVLSNVKMRGGLGEVQLAMLLENILAPDQYEANVKTKEGSADVVEFAIKMPNRDGDRPFVWLPIDAKFPRDAYEHLQNAYDTTDPALIEAAQKALESAVKKMARDICEKYIDVPNTTDFAILFLPFEGIYAEVVRKAALLEDIQRNCKVVITGPTTLAAILNSLQMGFRTLAIQKRSSEVWSVLGAVKKEFESFGGMLEKAQKNLQTASNQLDEVMGKRTRAIQRKLKGVEALSQEETALLLPDLTEDILEEE